ncbi:MAG: efflux RND transporter periplasmic adaptor subunit [Pseudomonadota bacterium]
MTLLRSGIRPFGRPLTVQSLAAAILLAAAPFLAAMPAQAQFRGPASVFVEPVGEQTFSNTIEALGTLEPNERVELTLNAADRVTEIYFDDGQRVPAGKTLLSLAQREQAALVEAAEADVDEARRQLERVERLANDNAVSQSELDQAQRNFNSASAQLRAVQSRQRDRVLVAPFDGVLGFRQVSVGSYVRPGDVVATLIDDSVMNLDFSVPSTFLTAVEPGLEIEGFTDDLPGQTFTGTVASVDNAIDPISRAVRVRAELPNENGLLKAGMFMAVNLIANPRTALAVPEEAIQSVGPRTFVWVAAEGDNGPIAARREVNTGTRQAGRVEILAGLETGQRVITEGIIRVREGAPLRIEDKSLLTPDPALRPSSSAAVPGSGGGASAGAGQ